MEERERMLDTIMEMQEWNIKKDKQIEELEDRWEKLKAWIDTRLSDYHFEGHIVSPETQELSAIINKMQELEKEKQNE